MNYTLSKQVGFKYALGDSWLSSAANTNFITNDLHKHAVLAVKTSRTIALSDKDRKNGKFIRVDQVSQGNGHFRIKAILMLTATKSCMEVIQGWL